MPTTTLDSGATDGLAGARRHKRAPSTLEGAAGSSATTYCYRESSGTRGTTTDLGAIPAGAEIERTVRS